MPHVARLNSHLTSLSNHWHFWRYSHVHVLTALCEKSYWQKCDSRDWILGFSYFGYLIYFRGYIQYSFWRFIYFPLILAAIQHVLQRMTETSQLSEPRPQFKSNGPVTGKMLVPFYWTLICNNSEVNILNSNFHCLPVIYLFTCNTPFINTFTYTSWT